MSPESRSRREAPLRVANCSGFFGDRLSAAREMVEGGPIDVLTGDWLAELTMFILHKTRTRSGGFAGTFVRQMEDVLELCVERGIKVVSNAGGLDPAGCAAAVGEIAKQKGFEVAVASVSGDDLVGRLDRLAEAGEQFTNLESGERLPEGVPVVTANAYLGAAPIAAALCAGADVVVTGRVTDASLVVGPGMWAFGWGPDDLDALAGAVVAGHVIECGAQCCGGNYAFFEEIPGLSRIGFPLVELESDGSSVVTKHPGTGGAVTVGTVTAQLLYEIGGPHYLGPDVVARFDTIDLAPVGPDRVRICGVRGEPPPPRLKVAANLAGGWRNAVTVVLTGGQVRAKAAAAEAAVWAAVPGGRAAFRETAVELSGDLSGNGTAYLRIAVGGDDERLVGRAFSAAVVETTLATFPGAFYTGAPSGAQEVARYWPTTVDASHVRPQVVVDGVALQVAANPPRDAAPPRPEPTRGRDEPQPTVPTRTVPFGTVFGARSGDKGGDANVGVWAESDEAYRWLATNVDARGFRALLPEVGDLPVDRYALPNLRAVNFVVHGLLGWGVASTLRADAQAKGLAELLRSRPTEVPASILRDDEVARRLAEWG